MRGTLQAIHKSLYSNNIVRRAVVDFAKNLRIANAPKRVVTRSFG
jgi:hypothetical protein